MVRAMLNHYFLYLICRGALKWKDSFKTGEKGYILHKGQDILYGWSWGYYKTMVVGCNLMLCWPHELLSIHGHTIVNSKCLTLMIITITLHFITPIGTLCWWIEKINQTLDFCFNNIVMQCCNRSQLQFTAQSPCGTLLCDELEMTYPV